jgi:hypothetical protein
MGISCPTPDSTACDRVGLSISLRRRARSATATIAGMSLKLNSKSWSDAPVGGRHRVLAGFLHPAGLRGGPLEIKYDADGHALPVIVPVVVTIRYSAGDVVRVSTDEPLAGGWG